MLDTTHKTLEITFNASAWPKQYWKSCANGSNIVALRFGDITEQNKCWELLVQMFNRFQTLHNNTHQHASGYCANGRKIVTSNNVASVCTGLDDLQQDVQTEATCNIQHCCVRVHGVSTSWTALIQTPVFSCKKKSVGYFAKYLTYIDI